MKKVVPFLFIAPLVVLLGSCCANTGCSTQDLYQDSLYLQFNQDPSKGRVFTNAEIDTVYLLRYNLSTAFSNRYDSIPVVRAKRLNRALRTQLRTYNLDSTTLVISNNAPFNPGTTGGKLSNYYYKLLVKSLSRAGKDTLLTFNINQIELQGNYEADGCCTYYHNTRKRLKINGQPFDVTETASEPQPIVLKKP